MQIHCYEVLCIHITEEICIILPCLYNCRSSIRPAVSSPTLSPGCTHDVKHQFEFDNIPTSSTSDEKPILMIFVIGGITPGEIRYDTDSCT